MELKKKNEVEKKDIQFDKSNALKEKIEEKECEKDIREESKVEFQEKQWQELRKKINKQLNTICNQNIFEVGRELINSNLLRGRGVFVEMLMKAQIQDSKHTYIYATLATVINSVIPDIGELLLQRLVLLFKKGYMKNQKQVCKTSFSFLSFLVIYQLVDSLLILQILKLLLDKPGDEVVEIAMVSLFIVGDFLKRNLKSAYNIVFTRLKDILHERNDIETKNQMKIEEFLLMAKNQELDREVKDKLIFINENHENMHTLDFEIQNCAHENLNHFTYDDEFIINDDKYNNMISNWELHFPIKKIDQSSNSSDIIKEAAQPKTELIVKDMTESDLHDFQKTLYLTLMSSMSADEVTHKFLKIIQNNNFEEKNNKLEIITDMVIKCCSQEKTYSKYYGEICVKLSLIDKIWNSLFRNAFKNYYTTIEKFNVNSIKNIGKLFGHIFASGALSIPLTWNVIKLLESSTTPESRIFLKFMFQKFMEDVGIDTMKQVLLENQNVSSRIQFLLPTNVSSFDNLEDLRFSINFFTSIGLGFLTDKMRDSLKYIENNYSCD